MKKKLYSFKPDYQDKLDMIKVTREETAEEIFNRLDFALKGVSTINEFDAVYDEIKKQYLAKKV